MENETPAGVAGGESPKDPKIVLVHPLTKDRVEVDNVHDALVPWMVKGYVHGGTK